jgi:hypothetical protein
MISLNAVCIVFAILLMAVLSNFQDAHPSIDLVVPLDHVFGDARLRDFKPELEQFAVDARRAPQRVLDTHSPDQCAQLGVNLRPPSKRARLPTPVPTKAGPMPTNELV